MPKVKVKAVYLVKDNGSRVLDSVVLTMGQMDVLHFDIPADQLDEVRNAMVNIGHFLPKE
jgi:hypothetical protein